MTRCRRFCVNVLAEEQQELSARFAGKGADRFANLAWTASPLGSPVLPGVCAWLDCELADVYPGGDHWIAVGRVRHCEMHVDRRPLLFHRGEYRAILG
jgi:3-hydroxy-9,10-secoandrosta-1,3,5(10)-triene-9,17-dione monooxygenase reductase component